MTIKEAADRLGVSKQTIRRYLEKVNPEFSKNLQSGPNGVGTVSVQEEDFAAVERLILSKCVAVQTTTQPQQTETGDPKQTATDPVAAAAIAEALDRLTVAVVALTKEVEETRKMVEAATATPTETAEPAPQEPTEKKELQPARKKFFGLFG